jgi:hypothetical protein
MSEVRNRVFRLRVGGLFSCRGQNRDFRFVTEVRNRVFRLWFGGLFSCQGQNRDFRFVSEVRNRVFRLRVGGLFSCRGQNRDFRFVSEVRNRVHLHGGAPRTALGPPSAGAGLPPYQIGSSDSTSTEGSAQPREGRRGLFLATLSVQYLPLSADVPARGGQVGHFTRLCSPRPHISAGCGRVSCSNENGSTSRSRRRCARPCRL